MASLPIILLVGAALRVWLFRSHSMAHWLSERPELVTPLTSWKRVTEGLALRRAGVAPYDGDVYHETPLMLRMVDLADGLLGQNNMWVLLLVVDLLTALILSLVAVEMRHYFLSQQAAEEERYISVSFPSKIICVIMIWWYYGNLAPEVWKTSISVSAVRVRAVKHLRLASI